MTTLVHPDEDPMGVAAAVGLPTVEGDEQGNKEAEARKRDIESAQRATQKRAYSEDGRWYGTGQGRRR